jgi:glycosyltransferase involved in cell wall biosynthesis
VFGKAGGGSENGWTIYPFVKFMGVTPNQDLPFYYRGASFYILTDIIAACPNSVIESLACGVPVIGYDTSVLPEMLTSQAGRCVPATGDPWRGEPPGNIDGLVHSALEIYAHNDDFRMGARNLAEERYGLERMVDQYISVLFQ